MYERFREMKEKELTEMVEERSIEEDSLKCGNNYLAYSLDDIRRIRKYDFLRRMENCLWPSRQPSDDQDFEILRERQNKVLFLDME